MEELFLESLFALDELDVVDEEHVDVAVSAAEVGRRVLADRVDVLVEERLGGDVAHLVVLVVGVHVVPDGVQQVGLAKAGRPVDEQRVVAASGRLGHAQGGGERELVGRALDEGLEGVPRVEPCIGDAVDAVGGGDHGVRRSLERGRVEVVLLAGLVQIVRRRRVDQQGVAAVGLEGYLGRHVDLDSPVSLVGVFERIGDERQVARLDPIAHIGARGDQTKGVRIGVDGNDVLECREPDRLGEL